MTLEERAKALNFGGLIETYIRKWSIELTKHEKRSVKTNAVFRRLSKASGITTDTLYKYSRNKSIPSLDNAYRIAQCLGFRLDELYAYSEDAAKSHRLENYPPWYLLEQLKINKSLSPETFIVRKYQRDLIIELVSTYYSCTEHPQNDDLLKEIACISAKQMFPKDIKWSEIIDELAIQLQTELEQICIRWEATVKLLGFQKQDMELEFNMTEIYLKGMSD